MTRRHAFGTLLGSAVLAHATEPYKVDPNQEVFAEAGSSPSHLVPTTIEVPRYYYLAQFCSFPSFQPSVYVALARVPSNEDPFKPSKEKPSNGFELFTADLDGHKQPKKLNRPTAKTSLKVSRELAEVVYWLWVNYLLEVRYTRTAYEGLDGETHVFSTFVRALGWMHGEIWTPQEDTPPGWLSKFAAELHTFALSDGKGEEVLLKSARLLRTQYTDYLTKNGKH